MKPSRKSALLVSLVAVLFTGTANLTYFNEYTYLVNPASFATPGFSDLGGDPTQAIQLAAQHWTAYAGAAWFFRNIGTTTSTTECSVLNNQVLGFNNTVPNALNCSTVAHQVNCGTTWTISFAGCARFTLGNPTSATRDFHLTATHEFGHIILGYGPGAMPSDPHHLAQSTNRVLSLSAPAIDSARAV